MTKSRKPRGPKEEALRAAREDNLAIPAILRRKPETPEQEAARVKKQAKEDRHNRFAESAGLKIIEPMDPKIRKAIEKEFRDPADVFVEPPKKIPAKKMPRALQKALAERDKLEAKAKPEHSAKATKQESEMRKSAKATSKPAPKKGQGPSKRDIVSRHGLQQRRNDLR